MTTIALMWEEAQEHCWLCHAAWLSGPAFWIGVALAIAWL